MPGIAGSQGATHLSGARLATLEILRAVLLDVARNLTLLPAPVAAHHHLGFTPFFLSQHFLVSGCWQTSWRKSTSLTFQLLGGTFLLGTLAGTLMATRQGDKHLLITVWMMPFPMTRLTAGMAAGEESIANMVALLADFQVKFHVSRAHQWKLCANTTFFLQRIEYLWCISKLCQGGVRFHADSGWAPGKHLANYKRKSQKLASSKSSTTPGDQFPLFGFLLH